MIIIFLGGSKISAEKENEEDIKDGLTTGPESATLAGVGREEEVGVGLLVGHV